MPVAATAAANAKANTDHIPRNIVFPLGANGFWCPVTGARTSACQRPGRTLHQDNRADVLCGCGARYFRGAVHNRQHALGIHPQRGGQWAAIEFDRIAAERDAMACNQADHVDQQTMFERQQARSERIDVSPGTTGNSTWAITGPPSSSAVT